jgi:hypothetical protein
VTNFRQSPAVSWRPAAAAAGANEAVNPPVAALPSAGSAPGKKSDAIEPLMAWPFVIVMFYYMTDFGRPQDWFGPLGALKPGMLALGSGIIALLVRRHQVYFPTRAKLIAAFWVLMCLGTPLATNRYWAYLCTKDFALFFFGAVIPLMSFVNTYARLQRLVAWILVIHVPLALYSITHTGVGIGSFLGDENDFCLAMNLMLPYAFFSFYFVKGFHRKIALVAIFCIVLFAITATKSRGGFLGLIAAAGYCWIASPRKIASLAVLAALTGPILLAVPSSYWDEMKTIETSTENDDTGAQRLYLWSMGWQMFKDYPWGVGPTNYQWNSYKYESVDQQAKGVNIWGKGSHSLYFTLLPEHGVVGVGIFVAILYVGFRENRAIRRGYKALAEAGTLPPERLQEFYVLSVLTRANDASVVAYLVTGAFLSVLYYPHLWLQVGMGVAIKRSFDIAMARAVENPSPVKGETPQPAFTPRAARA